MAEYTYVSPPKAVKNDTPCTKCGHHYGIHSRGIAGPCIKCGGCKSFGMKPVADDTEAEVWD